MLKTEQKKLLLRLARESILAHLEKRDIAINQPEDQIYKEKRGAFVTLHNNKQLRGCIGYIKPYKSLFQTIKEMARAAAFQDPRFPSISLKEMDQIDIEISILSELTPVSKDQLREITIGRDGLYIEGLYGVGLLLPQVAVEWNWDRETFLRETCHKAGLPGNCYLDPQNQIYRFSAEIFSEEI